MYFSCLQETAQFFLHLERPIINICRISIYSTAHYNQRTIKDSKLDATRISTWCCHSLVLQNHELYPYVLQDAPGKKITPIKTWSQHQCGSSFITQEERYKGCLWFGKRWPLSLYIQQLINWFEGVIELLQHSITVNQSPYEGLPYILNHGGTFFIQPLANKRFFQDFTSVKDDTGKPISSQSVSGMGGKGDIQWQCFTQHIVLMTLQHGRLHARASVTKRGDGSACMFSPGVGPRLP